MTLIKEPSCSGLLHAGSTLPGPISAKVGIFIVKGMSLTAVGLLRKAIKPRMRFVGKWTQMIRSHTESVFAPVMDLVPLRDRSNKQLVTGPMRAYVASVYPNLGIPCAAPIEVSGTRPNPAVIMSIEWLRNLFRKPFNKRLHDVILIRMRNVAREEGC